MFLIVAELWDLTIIMTVMALLHLATAEGTDDPTECLDMFKS